MVRRRDERGSLAPAMPVLAFMLLILAGLGIDGSRSLNARAEAVAYAEEAARAGASQVDLDSTELKLRPDDALAAAQRYCDTVMARQPKVVLECEPTGITSTTGDDPRPLVVNVRCKTQVDTMLLTMVGVFDLKATGTGKARPYEGIDKPLDPQDTQAPPAGVGGGPPQQTP